MQIGVLGPLVIRTDDGGLIEVSGSRLRALLIALALEPGRAVPKTQLVDWIWGEQPPADAANALQALVSRLRRALPDGSLDVQAGGYRLVVDPQAVDAVRFEQLLETARGGTDVQRAPLLREALELWRGAPMRDVDVRESGAVDAVVARFEGLHLAALEDRYEAEVRLGRGPELIAELTEEVGRNPLRERLAAALMRALAAAGRGSDALTVYQKTRETLADELGVDPSPELSELHVALLRGEVGPREEDRKTNLRAELTSYVGKTPDIAVVRELLAGHRLTTLTGPGGSGKTRLALETARTLLEDLPDGAWLVELAALGANGDVAQSALAALGLRDALLGGGANADPIDRLIAALREREALLVLDNCEHVIEAAAAFAHRVLGECQGLRILATSREPLGITGEAIWQVVPLALPPDDADPAKIESSPAVQLLRDRAGAVRQDLAADAATLETMARVCRALDGIPLAIELAAARLRTMSLDQLATRLDDRFRLLTGGSRTAIPQHRTLRAVVDWSWELLSDAERSVLRRLAVFAGGASLEAAEQVCASTEYGSDRTAGTEASGNAGVEQWEVLDLLTALTEKSLLLVTEVDGPRYRMLDTIRRYALDRLHESGDADAARRAHLSYFTGLAATAEPQLRRAEQLHWLAVLGAEHDNIAAAMRGALAAGDGAGALRLAESAGWYWWLAGHKAEGLEFVTAAANSTGEVDDHTRATVYGLVVHFLSAGRNDEQQLAEWIRKAHQLAGDSRGHHPALSFVGALERLLHGPDQYLPAFESLLADDDPWVRALARLQLGKMRTLLGQHEDADEYLETALAEFRALGERWGMSFALTELADRQAMHGEFASACMLFDEAVVAVTEVRALEDVARMRSRQAQLYWLLDDPQASAAAFADAQRCADQAAWPSALAELAAARAEVARWDGDTAEASRRLDLATTMLGDEAKYPHNSAMINNLRGYLATDLDQARTHHAVAFRSASEAGHAPLISLVLLGVADLALRDGQTEHAVQLLAASTKIRGLPDRSLPDAARIEREARNRLGDTGFTEAMGAESDWQELVATTLAC
ncbi:AfsR/SARP family transcriptional regulator [Nocardia huaxiensis]|uniref:AfsR/SARP family transcriptional regulator n=1 Tax=Nocardia huaxiensis TaxID=2755382 RepID=A0A7D6Z870_9NOCA|nr:AfsR/SARP family transcriptional regulator [Nocardia huaxiensis]